MKTLAHLFLIFLLVASNIAHSQVGINTTEPKTTFEIFAKNPGTKVEGIIIPNLTGDEAYNMPISNTTGTNSNLIFVTQAASTTNQTGRGINLTERGFYYWFTDKWVSITSTTTTINNILAYVKPMNFVYGDNNDYPSGTGSASFAVPKATDLKLLNPQFGNVVSGKPNDLQIINNPLNVTMWDNTTSKILVPQQLKGYSINISVSLKYTETSTNSASSRLVAYTGNCTSSSAGLYTSGGTKIKDVFFKQNPTSGFNFVRDELTLSNVIVTQDIVDHGIKLFIGASDSSKTQDYYEPVITVNYGVVNTSL